MSSGARGELALDRLAPLLEVLPALVVDRDDDPRADQAAQLDGVARGHRVAQRAGDRELHAAEVQQRGVDGQPVARPRARRRRARCRPRSTARRSCAAQREADHVADERVRERRAVAARRRGDLDVARLGRRLPRLEAAGVAAEPARAGRRGDHRSAADGSSARPAGRGCRRGGRGVSRTASSGGSASGGDRGPGQLARRRPPAEVVPPAGGIERRVGQQPQAAELDQRRRPADVGDLHGAGVATCASAHSSA